MEEWCDTERLNNEKEVLGLYVSGHPLARYQSEIKAYSSVSISDLNGDHHEQEVSIAGVVHGFTVKRSQKNGNRYAVGTLEDLGGTIGILVFARTLAKFEEILMSTEPLLVTGKVETEGDKPGKLMVSSVRFLREARRDAISAIHIKLDPFGLDEELLGGIKETFTQHRGDCPVYFHIYESDKKEKIVKAHNTFNIAPSEQLVRELSRIIGDDSIRYSIGR